MPNFNAARNKRNMLTAAAALSVGALGVACSGVNVKTHEVTVCDKEPVPIGDGKHEYRVYTADSEGGSHTFRVVDTLIVGGVRMNSADFYGSLREDVTYELTTSGYRVGALSQFPNITKAERLPDDQQHPEWCH